MQENCTYVPRQLFLLFAVNKEEKEERRRKRRRRKRRSQFNTVFHNDIAELYM